MESTTATIPLFVLSRTLTSSRKYSLAFLHRHFSKTSSYPFRRHSWNRINCFSSGFYLPNKLISLFFSGISHRTFSPIDSDRTKLACISRSCSKLGFDGGGGGGFTGDDSGRNDGNGASGENLNVKSVRFDEVSTTDVIVLDVGGMSCGGCASSVKRILESQPYVSSATVNLATETAVVWPLPEALSSKNWKQLLGEKLATQLTSCGFKSNLRDSTKNSIYESFERKMDEKCKLLRESGQRVAVSWALCAACLVGHFSHFCGNNISWIHSFHSTAFHFSLSFFTLLGPGRQLILDGLKSLLKGAPNMNTLVGLGALSSFAVSSIAVLIPRLGWQAFFEEPIMLIAFVLLGKNLEQRAKLKATSDMTGLLSVLPTKARLLKNDSSEIEPSFVEVSCGNLSVGDEIVVFPGDHIPADGIVKSGRSTIDESTFTGEPLPVTKLPGDEVTAGSINLNGTLTVEVRRHGGETLMGNIIRLVEEAQNKEAPVQRLADKIAGRFTYGVMALSAATFVFWSLFGSQLMTATLHRGNAVSLALQLSCSVLVVACPCALGLATPTAVLVGTSLGATRGLLLRGGDILEKFATVNTIVFDKTGTLTVGMPVVTKILTFASKEVDNSKLSGDHDIYPSSVH